jgi:hypothetical protein
MLSVPIDGKISVYSRIKGKKWNLSPQSRPLITGKALFSIYPAIITQNMENR